MQALRSYCRLAEAELLAQRTFSSQVIRERLGLTHPTHLLVACTLVERLLVQDEDYARAFPALVADLRARQVRIWCRYLVFYGTQWGTQSTNTGGSWGRLFFLPHLQLTCSDCDPMLRCARSR